jgi:hypothetical protein
VRIAVQRIARPDTSSAVAAVLSQYGPPSIIVPCAAAYHVAAQIDPKITDNKSSSEPRSLTSPLLRLVRVTSWSKTSDATQAQYSTANSLARLMLSSD